MSHFTVAVIHNKNEDLDALMSPYRETSDPNESVTQFVNKEEECKKEYAEGKTSMVKLEDGSYVYPWDERFRVKGTFGSGCDTHKIPEPLKEEEVSYCFRYANFDEFCKDYYGYKYYKKENAYGYYENVDAKWDWFQLGGRWTGMLKAKPYCTGKVKPKSKYPDDCIAEVGWFDSLRKGDIDFESMRAANAIKYDRMWEEAHEGVFDVDAFNKEAKSIKSHLGAMEIAALVKKHTSEPNKAMWIWQYGITEGLTKEQYIADNLDFSTFGVLKDGKWYEKGEMGWWACVSNEKAKGEWKEEFSKLLDDLDDDKWITIVDCHI